MQTRAFSGLFFALGLSAFIACGSSSTSSSTAAAASSSSSAGGATSSSASEMGGGGMGGMGGAPCMPMDINGCTEATAEDHTADAMVAIAFGGTTGFAYSPPCIKVNAGATVTFNGAFISHPLEPGEVKCNAPTVDMSSPIKETTTGMTASFMLPTAGTYPFYCGEHFAAGMKGAIFVK